MTTREKVIVSAYTGVLMCAFDQLQEYIEELLGRPVWTHELATDAVWEEIKEKAKGDFLALCAETTVEPTKTPLDAQVDAARIKAEMKQVQDQENLNRQCLTNALKDLGWNVPEDIAKRVITKVSEFNTLSEPLATAFKYYVVKDRPHLDHTTAYSLGHELANKYHDLCSKCGVMTNHLSTER